MGSVFGKEGKLYKEYGMDKLPLAYRFASFFHKVCQKTQLYTEEEMRDRVDEIVCPRPTFICI